MNNGTVGDEADDFKAEAFMGHFIVGDFKFVPEPLAKEVIIYMDALRQHLNLGHCVFFIHTTEDAMPGATASVHVNADNKEVGLYLGKRFVDRDAIPDSARRVCLVHEALHLLMEPPWALISEILKNELGRQASQIVDHVFNNEFEQIVDHMAWLLAPFMPEFRYPISHSHKFPTV